MSAQRFPLDEGTSHALLHSLRLALPTVDIRSVQEVGQAGTPDPGVLEWASSEGRIVITHDFNTMLAYAYERVRQGLPMPGVVAVPQSLPIGTAVEDIVLMIEASRADEWALRVRFIPL